jgi:cupin 2 domain-containing protein
MDKSPRQGNVFANIPQELPEELFETLVSSQQLRIERIVSRQHVTADGDWYDQAWDEWVLVLQGCAEIAYQHQQATIALDKGDYLLIPAHTVHRVLSTSAEEDTVWLAVHFGRNPPL